MVERVKEVTIAVYVDTNKNTYSEVFDDVEEGRDYLQGLCNDLFPDWSQKEIDKIKWISVKERLPEDNLEVLFFSQEYDGCFVGYKAAEGSYVDPESNGLSVSNIQKYYTYWRLLPEPPEEKK